MINNPHLTAVPENKFCYDICDKLPWVSWDVRDIQKGVTFCCNTNEIKDKILPFLPMDAM